MKTNAMLLGALLALPAPVFAQSVDAAHEHGEPRSAQVQAALDAAKARVPRPRWDALRERRVATGKSAQGATLVELDEALSQAVIVVLDENGAPHAECVDTAPAPERRP